ncbi:MFS transporter [Mesorhizobium sp. J8]|uniref:MFS transporter n=1 Tax=Mesorhizobium sp. J8 TaxID=2777475 RepID=UPI0019156473|nr:MFS transporter [Mesorhizobium sp. J8]BCM20083.1 hypothetical protein MJ8_38690 [Mesorhizobium sp. J8]
MRIAILDRTIVRTLIVLAVAQLIGWGSVGLLAIVGSRIAVDLKMSIAAVFAGNSVFYVVMGLWAPPLAKAFKAFGARRVMIMGTILAAPGFATLAASHGPVLYFTAWVILGTAGSAMLTTAAYIMLNEVAGSTAKNAIGMLMLMTGLSSSIFWPAAAFLSGLLGWRTTCLVYATAMVMVCLPLYAIGLPRRQPPPKDPSIAAATPKTPAVPTGIFHLIVSAITLNAFVTFGFSAILIELLKAEGLPAGEAVAFGSMLGILQVGARGLDFLSGGRWDGITTALFAGLALPLAMLLLITGQGARWSIAGFILLYGLGSGILAVSRATIPLVFYDQAAYAQAASNIALPLNLISAVSPPLLAGLLAHSGSKAVLGLATVCSCSAFVALLRLSRRRPAKAAAGAST